MGISSLSIRRPVLAIILNTAIVLFGLVSFNFLGIRDFPAVDPPIVSVSTSYTGASADVIESQITEPLEESVNGIAGVKTITSISRDGASNITIEFELEVDLEDAANDVRDRVSRAIRNLPKDVDNPVISKADANSSPIVFLNVQSNSRNHLDLTAVANDLFKERLQTIPGVSEIRIWGEKKYSMRLWFDPIKMAARGVTSQDVKSALDRENLELPSGRVEGDQTELTVRTASRLENVADFNNLIIREAGGQAVRLRDIGHAALGAENQRTVLKRDGIPMIGVVLVPQPGANHIAIADEFYKRLKQIKKDLPADILLGIGFDTTTFIRKSLVEVKETILLALLLVILVIFVFFRNWRTTLIPVLAIPIALLGSFFIMYLCGFSINILTLLGIVLATGLVVDDAIVVLENIYAKVEKGMHPVEAGHKGAQEIFFAIISTTLTLASVFLPILFLEGTTGRLFREFGMVVGGSVIISAFVSLTLTPMLCTRLLKPGSDHGAFYKKTEVFFVRAVEVYKGSLERFMDSRWMAFPIIAAAILVIGGLLIVLPSELAPMEDKGRVNMNVTAQEGVTFEFMDAFMDKVIALTDQAVPEKQGIISVTSPGFGGSGGVNTGFIRLILKDKEERDRSQQEIVGQLAGAVRNLTNARIFVSQEQTIGDRRGGLPVQFVLQTPDFAKLREKLPLFVNKAMENPVFEGVDVNLKFTKPELRLDIDREKARQLGVSAADIAQSLQLNLSGSRYGYFIMNGKQYTIIGQLNRESRDAPMDLKSIYVRGKGNDIIQLGNLISLSEQSSPPQLYRYNRYTSATISAGLASGKTIADGIAAMESVAAEVLDESFTTALSGPARDYSESASTLLFAFIFALVLIYMVLAAQFESFRDPFIVMFTVPLAFAGALISLWYFRQSLNIFSQIGIIMLIGLVTKNGILIVEFANQKKNAGLPLRQAILEGAVSRFRPIVMTTLTTVLGTLPIALALGAGAESRISMGIAVIGGLMFSLVLTLYVIPAMYSYFSKELKATDTGDPEMEELNRGSEKMMTV